MLQLVVSDDLHQQNNLVPLICLDLKILLQLKLEQYVIWNAIFWVLKLSLNPIATKTITVICQMLVSFESVMEL